MIEVSPALAILLYLGATTGILFGLWLAQHYLSKRKVIVIDEKTLKVCEFCSYSYLMPSDKKISQCPQCKSFNQ